MSGPKWTSAQRAAIDDRGGALLVSAAAGSGKTAVLTERAVRLITDPEAPIDADKLLIVTFTNAAAAELAGPHRPSAAPPQPSGTGQHGPAPPADAAAARAPSVPSMPSALTCCASAPGAGHPAGLFPRRPRQCGNAAGGCAAETLERAYADPDFCAFADLYGKGRSG